MRVITVLFPDGRHMRHHDVRSLWIGDGVARVIADRVYYYPLFSVQAIEDSLVPSSAPDIPTKARADATERLTKRQKFWR